jgi:uncharacterized protein YgiM (DUF1202 family)
MREFVIFTCLICILAACNSATTPTRTPSRIISPPTVAVTIAATNEDNQPLATPTASQTVARIQDCPNSPPIQLIIQERARVTDNNDTLNLRRGPGTNYEVVIRMNPGDIFTVLDGPACAGEYTWFRVRYRRAGSSIFYEGWIAEGDFESYYAEPYLPG